MKRAGGLGHQLFFVDNKLNPRKMIWLFFYNLIEEGGRKNCASQTANQETEAHSVEKYQAKYRQDYDADGCIPICIAIDTTFGDDTVFAEVFNSLGNSSANEHPDEETACYKLESKNNSNNNE